jgi:predicted nucleotide-binding protein (sugar kinase/HSP70/actin superfamily)
LQIGIPRALLYYWYGNTWHDFYKQCGATVVVSKPTERRTIAAGAEAGIEELCLPMKIFLGHLLELDEKVERVVVPHLIRVEKTAYVCPKFMGLPDIVAHALPHLREKMLVLKVGPIVTDMMQCLTKSVHSLGWSSPAKLENSLTPAQQMMKEYLLAATGRQLTFGLLGHPYCLYDSCFNLGLLDYLAQKDVRIVTPEMTPPFFNGVGSGKLSKDLFWTLGKSQFDALDWMLSSSEPAVDGFIQVLPFACGPEAIVGDLLERKIKDAQKPLLKLYFEEHSGEAGFITRLEAFIDLVTYRRKAC